MLRYNYDLKYIVRLTGVPGPQLLDQCDTQGTVKIVIN